MRGKCTNDAYAAGMGEEMNGRSMDGERTVRGRQADDAQTIV